MAYSLDRASGVMMDFPKSLRLVIVGLALLLAINFFIGLVFGQKSKMVEIDWEYIRKAFDTYIASPTEGNAERVLSALPNKIGDKAANIEAENLKIEKIFHDYILELSILVIKGDRQALRIAYNFCKFADGFFEEQVISLIRQSIVVMPAIFLEETLFFRKNNPECPNDGRFYTKDFYKKYGFLDQILFGYFHFEMFTLDVIGKEIRSRIKALESVDREDLLELRDECLRRLRDELKTIRRRAINRGCVRFSV